MKILYFAWLRTRVGAAEEALDLPQTVRDVRGLLEWLKSRSPGHAEALKDLRVVRVAVNQTYVQPDHPVANGDEVGYVMAIYECRTVGGTLKSDPDASEARFFSPEDLNHVTLSRWARLVVPELMRTRGSGVPAVTWRPS